MLQNSKFFLFILLFFGLQNNFYLTSVLSRSQGVGFGSIRAVLLVIAFSLTFGLIFLDYLKPLIRKSVQKIKINYTYLLYTSIFLVIVFFRLLLDISFDGGVDYYGVLPIAEGIVIIYMAIFLFHEPEIVLTKKQINFLVFFTFFNVVGEVIIYLLDSINFVSYGPFRSLLLGITVNRNPSFFFPIFSLLILLNVKFRSVVKFGLIFIFIIYLITLFYRTLYVALVAVYLMKMIRNKTLKLNPVVIVRNLVILVVILLCVNIVVSNVLSFDIFELVSHRFASIFIDTDHDEAKSARTDQIPVMLFSMLKNPLGLGFNGIVNDDNPIYNFAFYPLQIVLFLGWAVIPFFYFIGKRALKIIIADKDYYVASILIYLIIIFIFFPYANYFTLTSLFMFTLFISSKKIKLTP